MDAMSAAGPGLVLGLTTTLGVLIVLFIMAGFLLWSARIAGIENRTFGKAIGSVVLGGWASVILSLALGADPLRFSGYEARYEQGARALGL